jgi:hypothetical protein
MPNGAHTLARLRLVESTPIERPTPTEAARSIGIAAADAVAVVGLGLEAAAAGWHAPPPQLRRQAGEYLGRVAMLQLEHQGGDADFIALVRSEGKRILRERSMTSFKQHYGTDEATVDRALDEMINWVLEIAGNAVAVERAIQRAYQ